MLRRHTHTHTPPPSPTCFYQSVLVPIWIRAFVRVPLVWLFACLDSCRTSMCWHTDISLVCVCVCVVRTGPSYTCLGHTHYPSIISGKWNVSFCFCGLIWHNKQTGAHTPDLSFIMLQCYHCLSAFCHLLISVFSLSPPFFSCFTLFSSPGSLLLAATFSSSTSLLSCFSLSYFSYFFFLLRSPFISFLAWSSLLNILPVSPGSFFISISPRHFSPWSLFPSPSSSALLFLCHVHWNELSKPQMIDNSKWTGPFLASCCHSPSVCVGLCVHACVSAGMAVGSSIDTAV